YRYTRSLHSFPTRRSSDLRKLLGFNDKITSIDTPIGYEENKSLLDTIADENSGNPAELLTDEDLRAHIEMLLDKLTENQQQVIRSEEHTSELQSRENLVCR